MANKVVGTILYGSQNMGLSGPDSDRDYKLLIFPTFQDLYKNKSKHELPFELSSDHYSTMDVRQFDKLLRKGNPNIIELLYSVYQKMDFSNSLWYQYWEEVHQLYENGYVKQVWPQFFSAVKGIVFQTLEREYTRKNVSRAMFWIFFLLYVKMEQGCISAETWQIAGKRARPYRYNLDMLVPSYKDVIAIWNKFETSLKEPTWKNPISDYVFPSDLLYQAVKYEIIKGEYNA